MTINCWTAVWRGRPGPAWPGYETCQRALAQTRMEQFGTQISSSPPTLPLLFRPEY